MALKNKLKNAGERSKLPWEMLSAGQQKERLRLQDKKNRNNPKGLIRPLTPAEADRIASGQANQALDPKIKEVKADYNMLPQRERNTNEWSDKFATRVNEGLKALDRAQSTVEADRVAQSAKDAAESAKYQTERETRQGADARAFGMPATTGANDVAKQAELARSASRDNMATAAKTILGAGGLSLAGLGLAGERQRQTQLMQEQNRGRSAMKLYGDLRNEKAEKKRLNYNDLRAGEVQSDLQRTVAGQDYETEIAKLQQAAQDSALEAQQKEADRNYRKQRDSIEDMFKKRSLDISQQKADTYQSSRSGGKNGKLKKANSGTLSKMQAMQAALAGMKVYKKGGKWVVDQTVQDISADGSGLTNKTQQKSLYEVLSSGIKTMDAEGNEISAGGLGGIKGKNSLAINVLADILARGTITPANVKRIHDAGYTVQSFYDALGGSPKKSKKSR